jgi:NADP-dependent 3-hydroxy acid dehydrogenase YdfG
MSLCLVSIWCWFLKETQVWVSLKERLHSLLAAIAGSVLPRPYVFITERRNAELAAVVKEIGRNVTGVQEDVSNLGDLDRLFAQIKREKSKLDIVFANAAS